MFRKKLFYRNAAELPTFRIEYKLSSLGSSLIPVINSIVEWGYLSLQDEHVNKEMSMTPLPAIEAIEGEMAQKDL